MLVKDSKGREVELNVYGRYSDDIQVDLAIYTDDGSDVSDTELERIMKKYEDDIYLEWCDSQSLAADYYGWDADLYE